MCGEFCTKNVDKLLAVGECERLQRCRVQLVLPAWLLTGQECAMGAKRSCAHYCKGAADAVI